MPSGDVLFGCPDNMNLMSFYGYPAVCRIAAVAEALDEIQRDGIHADTVVILPPEAGDSSVSSHLSAGSFR